MLKGKINNRELGKYTMNFIEEIEPMSKCCVMAVLTDTGVIIQGFGNIESQSYLIQHLNMNNHEMIKQQTTTEWSDSKRS